jgi:hypothetical protein
MQRLTQLDRANLPRHSGRSSLAMNSTGTIVNSPEPNSTDDAI